jgi:hypothetical protein
MQLLPYRGRTRHRRCGPLVLLGTMCAIFLFQAGERTPEAQAFSLPRPVTAPLLYELRALDKKQRKLVASSGISAFPVKRPIGSIPVWKRAITVHRVRQNIKAQVKAKKTWRKLRRDFHKALSFSAGFWVVSYAKLHACAHAEGGHGPQMRYNSQGSGSYGHLQYMRGTWVSFSNEAFKTAKRAGLRVPPKMMWGGTKWSSTRNDTPFGQAFTTGWAFSRGLNHHWAARPCR